LPAGRYSAGTPIDIADGNALWRGGDKTNGFLMRSVDGRIPALEEGFSRLVAGSANPLFADGVIPWGNALWLDRSAMAASPHTLRADVSGASNKLNGVLKFEQGWQTGNPVQNYGLPLYSRGTVVRDGLVGYKVAMASGTDDSDYLEYLKGNANMDVDSVRTTYKQWVAALTSNGLAELCLFFSNASGFPVVTVVRDADLRVAVLSGTPGSTYSQSDFSEGTAYGVPGLSGHTFGGYAKLFEPENEAVFFDIRL
jgi:hypothetical protein